MRLRAPAKINLSLRIRRRREDGFHEIETVMAPVSLFDELEVTATDDAGAVAFSCDDSALPRGADNLVVQAAHAFLSAAGLKRGVRIALRKRIPHGAGLGGGSSDAAETLLGLNNLFGTGFDVAKLAELGATIGSDVPFFLYRSAAVCSGRGEQVRPTILRESVPLLLLKPSFGVPTPWAYSRWKNSVELPGVHYAPQQFRGITYTNDLERPVFEKHVFLARLKTWLRAQPEVGAALLSGSGSTVFAALKDQQSAQLLADRVKAQLDPTLWSCACETLAAV